MKHDSLGRITHNEIHCQLLDRSNRFKGTWKVSVLSHSESPTYYEIKGRFAAETGLLWRTTHIKIAHRGPLLSSDSKCSLMNSSHTGTALSGAENQGRCVKYRPFTGGNLPGQNAR